ncbi:MAG TPA: polyhydroxyalkanoate depolymerase [Candidatus Omnitrophota bacterium]|nr:polyhydroxyalkanoate depolymerase [Candidatus Omnitrophota bacterium]
MGITAVAGLEVEDRVVLDTPFLLLHHYRKPLRGPEPAVLVVAPMSGHFGWLMRDTVLGLLPRHEVLLLEWKDAREVPVAAGRFDLDRTISGVMDCVRLLGPGLTLLGVSQSATTILAATALMAAQNDPSRPCGLVLMGGFIDPRPRPTAVERLVSSLPDGWFSRVLAGSVPDGDLGAGRRVYSARYHWQALARYLARHMLSGRELQRKTLADDGADCDTFPFLRLYSTLMDLPVEFADDVATRIFRQAHLARGLLSWQGHAVEPAAIEDVALMTVEGARDDSSGRGHTLMAHALAHRIPDALREHHIEDEAGHFSLFHGRLWREAILPEVETFIALAARQCPVRVRRRARPKDRHART